MAVAVLLCTSRAVAMQPTRAEKGEPSSTRMSLRILGVGTAALLQYATQMMWPSPRPLLDEETVARQNFERERIEELEALLAVPTQGFAGLFALGAIERFYEARLIVLNEDPFDANDIRRILLFLRENARPGDTVVVQTEGAHTLTLENLYLMRMLVFAEIPGELEMRTPQARAYRRGLIERFTPRLLEIEERLAGHRVLPDGVQLVTYAPFANLAVESGEEGILAQTAAQTMAVQEALENPGRVFLIRNRAFSPYFFWQMMQNQPHLQDLLESKYHCTLRSLPDVLNCESFWLFRLLASLHRSLRQLKAMELFLK